MTDPGLILKATAPKASRMMLQRARLGLTSNDLADMSVIAVEAPAGFGKTTLLAQWRREALGAGGIAAWLTLDNRDHPPRFVQGLDVALRIAGGRSGGAQAGSALADEGIEALTAWLARVAEMAVEILLVLDDVHALPEDTLENSLSYLLLNAPPNLRIVLAMRRAVPLAFSELLASGRLMILDTEQLRFRPDETASALAARFGDRIDADQCSHIHDRTEGWPLGLQLAITTLIKSSDLNLAIARLSSTQGDLQRYFEDCLDRQLSVEATDLLVSISCLDMIEPTLCRHVSGLKNAEGQLEQLLESTPIFQGAVASNWLRIHPLAREFLLRRFERLPAEARAGIHSRAAHWLAEHDLPEEAAHHALQAGKPALAYDLVERCLYDTIKRGDMALIQDWIERLPPEEIERRPQLRLAVGWALAQSERHAEAATLVGPIIAEPDAGDLLRCDASEICATAALFTEDLGEMDRLIAPWADRLEGLPLFQQVVGTNIRAVVKLLRGDPEGARYLLEALPHAHDVAGLGYAAGWTDWILGLSHIWQGQVRLAEAVLQPALTHAEQVAGRRSPIAVMLAATFASALWDLGKRTEAAALLAGRLDVLERHAPPDAIILGCVTQARLASAESKHGKALDLLSHLANLGERRGLPRLGVMALGEQIRLHAARLQGEAAAVAMGRLEAFADKTSASWGDAGPVIVVQLELARATTALARFDWDAVLTHYAAGEPLARQLRRARDVLSFRMMYSVALQRLGRDGATVFAEAMSLAETIGLDGLLLETHHSLSEWKQGLASHSREPGSQSNSPPDRIPTTSTAEPERVHPSVLLTPKEREILAHLSANLSNKQIALALDVGEQTIKWHLKNLFGKLDAFSRQQVVARARMLGILG